MSTPESYNTGRKVWCLTRFANQSFRMMGVFTDREKAEKYAEDLALLQDEYSRKHGLPRRLEKLWSREKIIVDYWQSLQLDLEEVEINKEAKLD